MSLLSPGGDDGAASSGLAAEPVFTIPSAFTWAVLAVPFEPAVERCLVCGGQAQIAVVLDQRPLHFCQKDAYSRRQRLEQDAHVIFTHKGIMITTIPEPY